MENEQAPSGDNETLNSELENTPVETPQSSVNEGGKGDKVAYESYQKLLSEKKRMQAENNRLKQEAEARQKQELEAQAKFKELWESEKQRSVSLEEQVNVFQERWNDALKLDAFQNALGDSKRIDPKYSGFIDTSKILIDPETNKVDKVSAQREVERVVNEYPEIVKSTVTTHLPNETPSPGKALTRAEWLKLPAKEMAKRMKEVTGR